MKRLIASILVVLGTSTVRADDKATAEAAYIQAKQLAQQGKWAEACPLFLVSYHADQQIGVLLNLADCHEQLGLLATAWGEFREAEEVAEKRGDARAPFARQRSDALLPRLSKLVVTAPSLSRLVVLRDETDITRLVGIEAPVDAGEHVIIARAPGHLEHKQTITITGEGTTTKYEVPALKKAPDPPKPPPQIIERVVVQAALDYTHRDARRSLAYRIAIPGAIVTAIGLGFGLKARLDYDKARNGEQFCDQALVCTPPGEKLIDAARRNARIADVGIGLGLAALVSGVVVFATAPKGVRKESPTKTLRLIPAPGGAALVGSF